MPPHCFSPAIPSRFSQLSGPGGPACTSRVTSRLLERYHKNVQGLPRHISENLLHFPKESFERLNSGEILYKAQREMEEISRYNFALQSKLVRPRIILGFALLIQEASGGLDQGFFESETFQKVRDWAAVCEMIHNSSLIHVG